MKDAYRDASEVLRAKVRSLEQTLAAREREIEELKGRAAEQDAVLGGLKEVLERGAASSLPTAKPSSRSPLVAGAVAITALTILGGAVALAARPRVVVAAPSAAQGIAPANRTDEATAAVPTGDVCSTAGVKLNVDGSDAFAPATNDRDLAGHKYRKDGSRSPWFTVNQTGDKGPIHVHGVGDFLPGDLGQTSLSLLTITTKGETDGYRLARGGKSFLEVTRSDGKLIAGRFEADVSRVEDTTREPPFGTPVVRVRGTFCLPAFPVNPSDTGP